jgi:hypothetical protein
MILHCVLLVVAVALTAYFVRIVCHHHWLIVFLLIPMMRNVGVCTIRLFQISKLKLSRCVVLSSCRVVPDTTLTHCQPAWRKK